VQQAAAPCNFTSAGESFRGRIHRRATDEFFCRVGGAENGALFVSSEGVDGLAVPMTIREGPVILGLRQNTSGWKEREIQPARTGNFWNALKRRGGKSGLFIEGRWRFCGARPGGIFRRGGPEHCGGIRHGRGALLDAAQEWRCDETNLNFKRGASLPACGLPMI